MTFDAGFVLSRLRNTTNYAFFEVYAQVMRARPQRSLANPQLVSHLPVMQDLRLSLVKVIVENELVFVPWQQFQTL